MNTFAALIKREILERQNGVIKAPLIFAAFAIGIVVISTIGFGATIEFDEVFDSRVANFGDALEKAANSEEGSVELPAAVALSYWVMGGLPWIVMPFVVFFGLLDTLYEERRDRSILFWKSMPVADWNEVLAKFVTLVLVAPFIIWAIAIATQLVIALFLSVVVLFQGGPVLELWPLGLMVTSWVSFIPEHLIWVMWASPLLAWLLFVSSYASRMPFLWAILPVAALAVVEGILMETTKFLQWVGTHLGGGALDARFRDVPHDFDIDGPRDIADLLFKSSDFDALTNSLMSGQFWIGLVIAAGLVYGAIEMRKRAI